MNHNENMIVVPVNKGNATAFLKTNEHKQKIDLLASTTHKKLNRDSKMEILRKKISIDLVTNNKNIECIIHLNFTNYPSKTHS